MGQSSNRKWDRRVEAVRSTSSVEKRLTLRKRFQAHRKFKRDEAKAA